MLKKQLTKNIEDLDLKISKLSLALEVLDEDDDDYEELYESITDKMEKLTELRCKLADSKVNGSLKPVLISGAVGIGSLLLVLHYEKEEIITSKAINMLPSMFRGS